MIHVYKSLTEVWDPQTRETIICLCGNSCVVDSDVRDGEMFEDERYGAGRGRWSYNYASI